MATLVLAALLTMAQPTDIETLAEQAGVDIVELTGAVNATGLQPIVYLRMTGELPTPGTPYGVWDRLAECESGGNWHVNAYHDGGLQFHPNTWLAYGGGQYARFAYLATREQQIAIAQKVQRAAGWGQWPACSRRLGLR